MTSVYSLDEIEAFGRSWTDQFAKDREWENHSLQDPVNALEVFFKHIPGAKMLDVGCGWARYVSRFIDQGLDYQGLDHSSEMLKVAQADNPGLTFVQGSFRDLPYCDDHFDGLWSCCTLSGVPKAHIGSALAEHKRVLKSNGVLMIVLPSFQYSDESLYTDDDEKPTIYQAHYLYREFLAHIEHAGLTVVHSEDCDFSMGSMSFLARK